MHRKLLFGSVGALLALSFAAPAGASAGSLGRSRTVPASAGVARACASAPAGQARCLAEVVTRAQGSTAPLATAGYERGLTPADIESAYGLSAGGGSGRTVAVVEAKDYPDLASDLATYRKQFGLPTCTTASGCLRIVNQDGGTKITGNGVGIGWFVETALDVDAVSSACPGCHILVVEANSPDKKDLSIANGTAARLGAVAVSNSWKVPEFQGEATGPLAAYFSTPGVAFLASSGDGGSGPKVTVGFPSGLPTVESIGGTSLTAADNGRGWTESAWSGAGSACGQYVAKPVWQSDPGCPMRTTSDVSAVADPKTGLAVYETQDAKDAGWLVVGGTSLSSPLIAGVYGQAGNTTALGSGISAYLYAHSDQLNDVTTGSNGTCTVTYICQAGPGYDGPTGLGTPNGLGAF